MSSSGTIVGASSFKLRLISLTEDCSSENWIRSKLSSPSMATKFSWDLLTIEGTEYKIKVIKYNICTVLCDKELFVSGKP